MTSSHTLITCRTCQETKPETAFNMMRSASTGRQGDCRECARRRIKAWYAGLSPEAKRETLAKRAAWRRANPESAYWIRIKSVYGLTPTQFAEILKAQGSCCAICHGPEPGGRSGRWHVDHNHRCCPGVKSCGKCLRGLLCNSCNHGLGSFRDDPDALERAARYLRAHD
jgi:hypothetical protein